jgi:hypothetical protein
VLSIRLTCSCSRSFDVLGFDSFIPEHADGLQILRYNATDSYGPTMDPHKPGSSPGRELDSSQTGGNRMATFILYMSDLGEDGGGETVFGHAGSDAPEDQVSGGDETTPCPSLYSHNAL